MVVPAMRADYAWIYGYSKGTICQRFSLALLSDVWMSCILIIMLLHESISYAIHINMTLWIPIFRKHKVNSAWSSNQKMQHWLIPWMVISALKDLPFYSLKDPPLHLLKVEFTARYLLAFIISFVAFMAFFLLLFLFFIIFPFILF